MLACLRINRGVAASTARLTADLPGSAVIGRDLHPLGSKLNFVKSPHDSLQHCLVATGKLSLPVPLPVPHLTQSGACQPCGARPGLGLVDCPIRARRRGTAKAAARSGPAAASRVLAAACQRAADRSRGRTAARLYASGSAIWQLVVDDPDRTPARPGAESPADWASQETTG